MIDYSNCTDNTCQCVHGYYESADNTECISRVVGDSCDVDLDCTPVIDNSFCDVTCTCVDGYTLQTGGKSCGEIIVGDTCSTDTQCDATIDNSVCDSGECACISGYASNEKGSICTERVLGDKCSDDIDCYDAVEYSVCIGKCVCDEGYMDGDDGASCLLRILGDPCQEDADCTLISNSECSESTSTCECLTLFSETPETARCLPCEYLLSKKKLNFANYHNYNKQYKMIVFYKVKSVKIVVLFLVHLFFSQTIRTWVFRGVSHA